MDRLNELTDTLNDIRKFSKKILSVSLPVMECLTEENNELVNEFICDHPDINKSIAVELLQNVSLTIVEDPSSVIKEIDRFTDAIMHGEVTEEECPFFAQVWAGDMYDEPGIEGLKCLRDELRQSAKNVGEEQILDLSSQRL